MGGKKGRWRKGESGGRRKKGKDRGTGFFYFRGMGEWNRIPSFVAMPLRAVSVPVGSERHDEIAVSLSSTSSHRHQRLTSRTIGQWSLMRSTP